MQRYRVDLEELEDFVKRSQAFEERAEGIAAAEAHHTHHQEWTTAAAQMREGLGDLRTAATTAHQNYTEVVDMNRSMWP